MKKNLFLLSAFLMMATCVMDRAYMLYVENKSDKPIYFCLSRDYHDTVLHEKKNEYLFFLRFIKAHDYTQFNNPNQWEKDFSFYFPKDTLLIFFFRDKGNTILERRIYSKQDLQNSGWRIVYP